MKLWEPAERRQRSLIPLAVMATILLLTPFPAVTKILLPKKIILSFTVTRAPPTL